MFKLNIKIALRNIWKNKLTTCIKLIGLVVGLSTVVLLVAYVMFELSYEKGFKNSENIYRIQTLNTKNNEEFIRLPTGLGDMLVAELPEVVWTSVLRQNEEQVQIGKDFYTQQTLTTQSNLFELLNIEFKAGNAKNALKDPNTVVVSENFASKVFPKEDAIGKVLNFQGDKTSYVITGVIADLPSPSHIQADIIKSYGIIRKLNWKGYSAIPQYISLREGSNLGNIEAKFKELYKKYQFPKDLTIKLLPMQKIHLYSHATDEMTPNSDIKYIYIFSIAAILILLIAIVNFVNLTVAASLKRGKEIGVKKVMGASVSQLRMQFLSESYLYFIFSAFVVLLIAHDLVPLLGNHLGIAISLEEMINAKSIAISIAIIILSGFIAGLYPAVILSRLMPAKTLKGYVAQQNGKYGFKKFLMVFQFGVSAFLIICTLVISSQLQFIKNKNLGFNKDFLLVSSFNFFREGYDNFKNELISNSSVKSIAMSSFSPGDNFGSSSKWTNDNDTTEYAMDFIHADINFINTLGIKVVKGRDFSIKYGSDIFDYEKASETLTESEYAKIWDRAPIILNQAAVKLLNLKNPIDTVVKYGGLQGTVIGVVADFNGMSLHQKVKPLAIKFEPKSNYGYMYIKISGNDVANVKSHIDDIWRRNFADRAPNFQFVDQHLQKLYIAEMRLGSFFSIFSAIAIFLCLIGLFGMVYFDMDNRTKEIAVRKILGATINDLLTLLNSSFVKIVVFGNLIIWPIAYYLAIQWLNSFSYRVGLSYQPFLIALLACLALTILTVSIQALKIVKKSPVKALKYE